MERRVLYILKQKRSFVCPSVNLSVYTLTLKRSGLQFQNLVQKYQREFLRKHRSGFFKKSIQIFLKTFLYKLFFNFTILCIYDGTRVLQLKIWHRDTKEGFREDLEAIFSKLVLDYLQRHIKILNICSDFKSRKNVSIVMKFGCVFAVNNFSLYAKNCDQILDNFYRDASKS